MNFSILEFGRKNLANCIDKRKILANCIELLEQNGLSVTSD